MTETTGPISSAVILPDPEPPISPRTKRRQSSVSETASKRLRLSNDSIAESSSAVRASPPIADVLKQEGSVSQETAEKPKELSQDRRKSSAVEEKKRGQRLFGGMLSALSQSTPNGQQKRRLEIEKRQAERAKQHKLNEDTRKAEKLTKLKEVRKTEQVKFEEESMHLRHSNMLAMANFLCTKAQPKIYYKPWELLPTDEDRIKTQIAEANAIISREVDEFSKRHPKPQKPASETTGITNTSKETVGEPLAEPPSDSNVPNDSTNTPIQDLQSEQVTTEKSPVEEQEQEHNGEVVVEAEEDTVIY